MVYSINTENVIINFHLSISRSDTENFLLEIKLELNYNFRYKNLKKLADFSWTLFNYLQMSGRILGENQVINF